MTTSSDEDDETDAGEAETETAPEAAPGTGNRRARRRGLRPKATEVEDPGGDDAPPII